VKIGTPPPRVVSAERDASTPPPTPRSTNTPADVCLVTAMPGAIEPNTAVEQLKTALARLQVRLIDAQTYACQSLSRSPLVATLPDVEAGVAAQVAVLAAGAQPERASIEKLVARTQQADGPAGLMQLISVAEQQLAGAAYELRHDARRSELKTASDALLGLIAAACFAELARGSSGQAPDHRGAFASMLAANEALACSSSATATYGSPGHYERGFHPFSNEGGFGTYLDTIDARGGAAIGVSGALLDLAGLGSDLIVSVDADPDVADAIKFFAAVLLVVDKACVEHGWDDARRAQEVHARVLCADKPQEIAALKLELASLGLPAALLERLPHLMESIERKNPTFYEAWCGNEKGVSPRACGQIAHLSRLALEGRIVAVTADLADPALVDRISALLDAHGSQVKLVHFSNVLDYVPDIRGVCRNFGRLPLCDDALLTTTAQVFGTEHRFVDWAETQPQGRRELLASLGTFASPAILRARDWLGEGCLGDSLHEAVWSWEGARKAFWASALERIAGWDTKPPPGMEHYAVVPKTVEELVSGVADLEREVFERPDLARLAMKRYLENDSVRWVLYYLKAIGREAWDELELPVPKSLNDLPRLADEFEASFWTKEHKLAYLERELLRGGQSLAEFPGLKERVLESRTCFDLSETKLDVARGKFRRQ
jgi:hypothetical protein